MGRAYLPVLCVSILLVFAITDCVYAGTFTVTNLNDSGEGSLRWAIEEANIIGSGPDTIDFSVSGTISLLSGLPMIEDDETVIDASSRWIGTWPEGQPGIILDGRDAGGATGLAIYGASDCHIRGLFVTKFGAGILIEGGGQYNTIGGTDTGYRNVISENDSHECSNGITISGPGTNYNEVLGNYIGTDANGTADLGNSNFGIHILQGAQHNTIGGSTPDARNIISGNGYTGVGIWDSGSDYNEVSGNYIGTDSTGSVRLGNHIGVNMHNGAQHNIIGGSTPGERNIISGNNSSGVDIGGQGANYNIVSGNYIGTDVSGTVDLGNSEVGIGIWVGAQFTIIGGSTPGERNIISGNDWRGVAIYGANNNVVSGNYIGTDDSGTMPLGNSHGGVWIWQWEESGAQSNTIGGADPGKRNIISGNNGNGITISGPDTNYNAVLGNYIGTDVNGTADLGNSSSGIQILQGAHHNTIGGLTPDARNIISGNDYAGVGIWDPGSDHNKVSGNYIGIDSTGNAGLGNHIGITIINGAQNNTIGGSTPGERNIISGNNSSGLDIVESGTNYNVVIGNYIGTDASGTMALGNSEGGVGIWVGAQSNIIGGTTAEERNIISGNDCQGISIGGTGTINNVISGNYIGTDVNGTADLGNSGNGVQIGMGAQHNTIGGSTPGARNVISGNGGSGVLMWESDTSNNIVSGNYIGTDVNGTASLGNSNGGVNIVPGAQSNIIGGTTAEERNIISGNDIFGIFIGGAGTDNNIVSGNYIGTDVNGTAHLGNLGRGIWVTGGAQFNTIGGTGNTISFNDGDGVLVDQTDTDYNKISRNSIHSNSGLGIQLADGGNDEIPAPIITSIILAGDTLHVEGENAGTNATVEIFEADSPQSGEGMTYLGSLIADGTGDFSGNINVTGKGLEAGEPVTSTTTHTSNNTSGFSPTVNAQSHVEAINDMVATVEAMNLQEGLDSSLDAKLEAARDSLEAANAGLRNDAARKLEALINAVEAQRGKQLSDEQADELVSLANSIISALRGVSAAPAKQSKLSPDRKLSTVWGKIKAK